MGYLIVTAIENLAKECPDNRFALVPQRVDSREGAIDLTWSRLQIAIDKSASWIEGTFGKAEEGFPTLGFLSAPSDIRYPIFMMAAIKVGYKIFLPSPRNTPEFHTHLLNNLSCSKFVSPRALGDWAANCQVKAPPSLEELIDPTGAEPYPYTKTWEQAKDDKILAVHSSGSTGPPKPIVLTNGWMNATLPLMGSNENHLLNLFTCNINDSRLVSMPLFHPAGLLFGPIMTIMSQAPMTIFPASSMVTTDNVIKIIETFDFKTAYIPPSILEEISTDPKQTEVLGKLDAIAFGGGPVGRDAGRILNKVTTVYTAVGSSEAGIYPILLPGPEFEDPHLWSRFPDEPGVALEPQEDDLFEFVYKRQPGNDWTVFHAFPELDRYETQDLYERHPSDPQAWRLVCRKDDVIVLSNGEKVVSLPMEDIIRLAPEVNGVIYAGHGKFTVSAVVELTKEAQQHSKGDILASIAPFIKQANQAAPGFGHLTLNMIVFTDPEKPMLRTGKGSIIRKAVLRRDYVTEIEALYEEQDNSPKTIALVHNVDEAGTMAALTGIFTELSGKPVDPDEDLFQSTGIDSMQVLTATRILRASARKESSKDIKVSPSLIYSNPTIRSLAQAIRSLIVNGSTGGNDRVESMEGLLLHYSEGIAASNLEARKLSIPETVILTGSTGSLGSYLLDILINDSSIKQIYALNRSEAAPSRQQTVNSSRGLSTDFSKVTFLNVQFGSPNFGLSLDDYHTLVETADLIVHNAWSVDFNQTLSSFEPHIRGVRSFIDLAATSLRKPHIVFISSIGIAGLWETYFPGTTCPETLLRDPRVAADQGYGAGKYVSEHLLNAATAAGVDATICRVGQVAGPITHGELGVWNKQEWLPSIIASSKYLGILPDSLGNDVANWVPVDIAARAVVELGLSGIAKAGTTAVTGSDKGNLFVYNLVNPKGGRYSELVPTIRKYVPEIKELVSFERWVQALRASTEKDDNDASTNPATKLVDFYEGLLGQGLSDGFETDAAVANSRTMADTHAVEPEWMDVWMRQWRF